jgi:hypothetical protein
VTANDEVYDLEPAHSAERPSVRRIKLPHLRHEVYRELTRHAGILAVLKDLLGPAIRFDTSKLNMKPGEGGSPVEWHQDWAFYPATNDDLCAVGVMLDDCDLENGPLMVIPGSHRGGVYSHHTDGYFCGAIAADSPGVDFGAAKPLVGHAGSISVHHVRAVHGSAPNRSARTRQLLLLQYAAADAWPLLPGKRLDTDDFAGYMEQSLVCGTSDPVVPRMTSVPVRLPLPKPDTGSIFELQQALGASYFQ